MSRALDRLLKVAIPFKEYLHTMTIVFTGSTFAEMIPICMAPFLTRLYIPEDFGRYGLIISVSALLAQFSTLRYENSIIIAKDSQEVFFTWKLCEYLIFTIHVLFILAMTVTYSIVEMLLPNYSWGNSFFLIPLVSLGSALFRVQILVNNRNENFSFASRIKVVQASLIATFSITLGIIYVQDGLIWALILGNLGGVLFLRPKLTNFPPPEIKKLMEVAKRYSNFAYYALPGELVNNATSRYPLMVFPFLFGNEIAGYLTLSYRVVAMPARFVANAVSEVFFQRASKEMRDKHDCRHLFLLTAGVLLIIGLLGFGSLYLLSDHIFEVFFGEQWKNTGEYIKFLIPLFLVSFVVSPLSSMIYVAEKQKWDFFWHMGNLILITSSSLVSYFFFEKIEAVLLAFVMAGSCAYFVYFIMLLMLTKGNPHEIKRT
ncbi:MAG: oligosaccharide flippase family protein [Ignavibacteria bacterium]|nr:oligosaccharide flippase family protein [Ignavibacteria bacterium]